MTRRTRVMIIVVLAILGSAGAACGWEVEYDASTGLFPSEASPVWQSDSHGAPVSLEDGVLHIGDSISGGADYRREATAIGAGVPVTMEAQMRVVSSSDGEAGLQISTYSVLIYPGVFPDHIVAVDRYYQAHVFWGDFTTFHTIRLAYDGSDSAYIWVDNQLALSFVAPAWSLASGSPGGVSFGSYSSDSYWQYVNYSKQYLPIPEPSSLAAFLAGSVGFGAAMRRRRAR
jgi:hypothetical protein